MFLKKKKIPQCYFPPTPALPPHQFLAPQKQGRLIRTVRKDDFQVTNTIRGHARHNTRAYVVSQCATEERKNSFFVRTTWLESRQRHRLCKNIAKASWRLAYISSRLCTIPPSAALTPDYWKLQRILQTQRNSNLLVRGALLIQLQNGRQSPLNGWLGMQVTLDWAASDVGLLPSVSLWRLCPPPPPPPPPPPVNSGNPCTLRRRNSGASRADFSHIPKI